MTTFNSGDELPVVIIGAGPIGLAAAAHLHARSVSFLLLEATSEIAGATRQWAHVRMFTPWRYNVDRIARELLESSGWELPDPDEYPTGGDLIRWYLEPLARHPAIAPSIRFGQRVVSVTRHLVGKLDDDRDERPFAVWTEAAGNLPFPARAVIDCSGVWSHPNPLGADGRPIPGERANAGHIAYGPPDILGSRRERYTGRRTLVVGSGHSAFNALDDLCRLRSETGGEVHWALRRDTTSGALDGCDDTLTERTLLKREIRARLDAVEVEAHSSVRLTRIERSATGLTPYAGERALPEVDEIVVATGFRPDHSLASELRLDLHHTFECAHALADLIDPDVNACGTTPPHGVTKLAHPELDFHIVGAKSYGRAPTFLLLTGYEQVRSIVCAIERDDAAFEPGLDLPERGLCAACTAFLDERDAAAGCSCATGDDETGDCCDDEETGALPVAAGSHAP